MLPKMPCLLWIAFALTVLPSPARAENPKVSLKVANATCAEATAALSKAAGIPVEIYAASGPVGGLEEKATFDWNDATFARALRQLCERYRLRPSQRQGGYTLYPGMVAAPPAKRVGLVEKNGVRLFARGVSVNFSRRISFVGDQGDFDNSNLSLELGCELENGDADAIAGIENVSARDDTGNVILSQAGRSYSLAPYPDEWQGGISLSGIPPRAKKLEWVEGDLMVYKRYQPRRLEIALPLPEGGIRRQVGDTVVELSRFEPAAGGAEQGAGRVPGAVGLGPKLQVRFLTPPADAGAAVPERGFAPMLVGASGRTYWQFSGGTSTRADPFGVMQEINAEFSNVPEPVTRIVVQWVDKSQPVKLLSFRMENIPLPPEGAVVPRRALPLPRPRAGIAPLPDRPYEEKGGGILLNRIEIQGRPASEGTLSLGLALKSGAEWSGIRWQDLDLDKEGVARLPDLKPGTYRLLRIYRPKDGRTVSDTGRWLNGEVQVTVAAGKESVAPPLRWEPEGAETKPAAPARVAPAAPLKKAR